LPTPNWRCPVGIHPFRDNRHGQRELILTWLECGCHQVFEVRSFPGRRCRRVPAAPLHQAGSRCSAARLSEPNAARPSSVFRCLNYRDGDRSEPIDENGSAAGSRPFPKTRRHHGQASSSGCLTSHLSNGPERRFLDIPSRSCRVFPETCEEIRLRGQDVPCITGAWDGAAGDRDFDDSVPIHDQDPVPKTRSLSRIVGHQ